MHDFSEWMKPSSDSFLRNQLQLWFMSSWLLKHQHISYTRGNVQCTPSLGTYATRTGTCVVCCVWLYDCTTEFFVTLRSETYNTASKQFSSLLSAPYLYPLSDARVPHSRLTRGCDRDIDYEWSAERKFLFSFTICRIWWWMRGSESNIWASTPLRDQTKYWLSNTIPLLIITQVTPLAVLKSMRKYIINENFPSM